MNRVSVRAALPASLAVLSVLWFLTPSFAAPVQEESVEPVSNSAPFAEQLREIIESVMEHHIDPPTRQQLVLETLRASAVAGKQRLPADLSTRLSGLSDEDAIYSLMQQELTRLQVMPAPPDEIRNAILGRLSVVVPGGLVLNSRKEHYVNEQLAANRYVGIGVAVGMDDERHRMNVMTVIEGGTAAACGVLDHDIIETVDGRDTYKVPLEEVLGWLRGPAESVVKVTVRSPGAEESRDLEIPRRVVPIRTALLIPQEQDSAAALIRLDRIAASSVHEISRIIAELPESATLILDLRFCREGNLHHVHLLADAILEECRLGDVETRHGTRQLNAEAETITGGRRTVLVHHPHASEQFDWLAAVVSERGVEVFRDEFPFLDEPANEARIPQPLREFVPVNGGTQYLGMSTSRLLLDNGKPLDHEHSVGTLIVPDSSAATVNAGWNLLAALMGSEDTETSGKRFINEIRTIAGPTGPRPIQDPELIRFVMAPAHEE